MVTIEITSMHALTLCNNMSSHIIDTNINNTINGIYVHPQHNIQYPRYLQDYECYLSQVIWPVEPQNHHLALKDAQWVTAMKKKLKALYSIQT